MTRRNALLVGSMPFENEETCMRMGLDALGTLLFSLPDGEIGEKTPAFPKGTRTNWISYAIEKLHRDTANWRALTVPARGSDGFPLNYQPE